MKFEVTDSKSRKSIAYKYQGSFWKEKKEKIKKEKGNNKKKRRKRTEGIIQSVFALAVVQH